MATATPPNVPPPPPANQTQKVSEIIATFRPARRFRASDSKTSVTSLDFDDTGELAIVARDDDTLQIYNCKEGKHAKELKSQKYGVHLARFSHNAANVLYASTKVDGTSSLPYPSPILIPPDTIRYLSTHDNSYLRYFKGHTDTVTCISVCPASDSFISSSRDNTVRIWDLRSSNFQGLLRLHAPYLAAYDPSASVIAIASPPTHTVLLYDMRNYDKPPFATFDLLALEQRFLGSQGGDWNRLEFSNDGKSLVIGTTGAGHFVLDAFSGEINHFCRRKGGHSGRLAAGIATPNHNTNAGNGAAVLGQGDICISPDGQYVIGGSGEDGLLVWDITKSPTSNNVLDPVETLPGNGRAAVVGYNPRTNLLATADREFFFWQPDPDLMM
ncbi:WD repeat-containing protein-like protein [Amniculicola lignicola CBS 123094]|uniref:WD repeat-containing protein-like protein n=1 Tax=Amniculicola lignicola CBS 123094 TaxID=1392246 RepID=A0A6A5WR09_9PLEO|nr:WD repeat-containing protein-like protein [Amniculicola lignicola CBS 123094]